MNLKVWLRVWLVLAGLSASTALAVNIVINGQTVPGSPITVGGKMYVPLDSLKAAGFSSTLSGSTLTLSSVAGGANQIAAVQGCLNQPLFNGVWRVKFSNLRLATVDGSLKWNIDVEIGNGTKLPLSGLDGALLADGDHLTWVLADGTPLNWGTYDTLAGQKFTFANLPPAGTWKGTLTNVDDGSAASAARKPSKLLWRIDVQEGRQSLHGKLPWVKDPSFRIDLTCTK